MRRLASVLMLLIACSPAVAADTLLAVTSSWCGPCKAFKADLERDPSLVGGRKFRLIDMQEDRDEARRLRVRAVPTFILLRDGREVRRMVGYDGPDVLKRWLDRR